jgi:hypothetical protein
MTVPRQQQRCMVPADVEVETAYWICPPRSDKRHATLQRPGALVEFSAIKALCGATMTIPLATPYGQEPRSRQVRERCSECATAVDDSGAQHTTWDF